MRVLTVPPRQSKMRGMERICRLLKLSWMKKTLLLLVTAIIMLASCKKGDHHPPFGIFPGPHVNVFDGEAWTWIQLDKEGHPQRVAISLTDAALNSADSEHHQKTGHQEDTGHMGENNFVLDFHPKAETTIFRHAWLNWNPMGHPPPGIYDDPHFDFHYYTVSSDERETFVDPVKLDASLPAEYLPPNYEGGDLVPAMGKHYSDLTSPEFNGQPFTQTYIYGSYDSKFIFVEPMITLEFLKTTDNFERPLPQPAKFQETGYYPTKMRVTKAHGVTDLILEDFVLRTAS
jgi:hypothetical protein